MPTPPPAIQQLARQLLARGPTRAGSSADEAEQAARAFEMLRVPLAKLVGTAGFASLLSRALALAKRQAPSLEPLRVEPEGTLARFDHLSQGPGAAAAGPHATAILLAEFLGLLVTFIGYPLTLTLVREAWPDAAIDPTAPSNEESP